MVDLRKLFNQLQEVCEEESIIEENDLGSHSSIELFPDIENVLFALKEGIDEIEKAVETQKEEADTLSANLEEISNSLY